MNCPICNTEAIDPKSSICWTCFCKRRSEGPLTYKQQTVLDYICTCWLDGWLPTQHEIMGMINPSGGSVTCTSHMGALVRKGWITRRAHRYQLTQKTIGKAMSQ